MYRSIGVAQLFKILKGSTDPAVSISPELRVNPELRSWQLFLAVDPFTLRINALAGACHDLALVGAAPTQWAFTDTGRYQPPQPNDLRCCVRANIDPSDRYVQCSPGRDGYRLRADESGYDNLFLAGDWTDNGLNAGCIQAATLSGLRAANAVLGVPGATGSPVSG